MSKQSRGRRRRQTRRERRTAARSRRSFRWQPWAVGAAVAIVVVGLGALVVAGGGQSTADAATEALARENSNGPVRVLTGRAHTVYHSTEPLPTSSSPRADGRPTLVWFSATWCTVCDRMDGFVHEVVSQFTDRIVFVEKSVDHDRDAASKYAVRGTPTFVLIDAEGRETASRFYYQTADGFARAIEAMLAGQPLPTGPEAGPTPTAF